MKEFKLGTYIKKHREALRISQEDLSQGLCSVSTLSRIENNQQTPSRKLTKDLLERLGLPKDKFIALWSQKDVTAGALIREIHHDMIQFHRLPAEEKTGIKKELLEKLNNLEEIADPDDRSTQQFLLAQKARLSGLSNEEKLSMQLDAIRLTCPKLDLEDLGRGHYSEEEFMLITQIARTYSQLGQRKRAIDIYRQLLRYIEKNCKDLSWYANNFCLVAHNYAINLVLDKHYQEATEIAEQGRQVSLKYVYYQFLPGFLAVQAECNYFLGDLQKSGNLYLLAYYTYKAFEDKSNQKIMRHEMKKYLGIELPE